MGEHARHVLVVEDEREMQHFLRVLLESHDFVVATAATGTEAIRAVAEQPPDVVLLDLGLPDMEGLEVARQLREWTKVPIVVISARGREDDKVDALDMGADDYITKPFGSRELLARLRAALRRTGQPSSDAVPVVRFGRVVIDRSTRRVHRDDEEVHLTRTEYQLLGMFLRHPDRVLTHRQLLVAVWGPSAAGRKHYVRVYMAQLRQKLEEDPARPAHLVTETGVGYRLVGLDHSPES